MKEMSFELNSLQQVQKYLTAYGDGVHNALVDNGFGELLARAFGRTARGTCIMLSGMRFKRLEKKGDNKWIFVVEYEDYKVHVGHRTSSDSEYGYYA
jgi:3-phosphoglycerate kinase